MKAIIKFLPILLTATVTTSFAVHLSKEHIHREKEKKVQNEFNRQLNCLSENIYYEASFQPYEGKLAVAQVTVNRSKSKLFPKNVCAVVRQKNSGVCQFSWVCKPKKPIINEYEWQEAKFIARKALTEPSVHMTIYKENVMYYHASYIHPQWKRKRVVRIGEHVFYK